MKFEQRVDELLLKVGPGAYWKDTTLYKTFNPVQRKKLFELYISKTYWTDSCQIARDDNGNKFYKRDPNVYVWKDQEAISARYNKLVSDINPHAPKLGRKPIADAQYKVQTPEDNWEAAIEKALELKRYSDISILTDLDRKVNKETIIITSPYNNKYGRLFTPLQHICRPIRHELFRGKFDYDIETALPSIFYQLFPHSKLILEYINEKDLFRNYLADEVGIDYQTAKRIINSLFFGIKSKGAFTFWTIEDGMRKEIKTYIPKILGEDSDTKLYKLLKNRWFKAIAEDIRFALYEISRNIRENHSVKLEDGGWEITNPNGDTTVLTKWNPLTHEHSNSIWNARKAVAFWYFGIESKIMSMLPLNPEDTLRLHDGFITTDLLQLPDQFKIGDVTFNIKFVDKKLD